METVNISIKNIISDEEETISKLSRTIEKVETIKYEFSGFPKMLKQMKREREQKEKELKITKELDKLGYDEYVVNNEDIFKKIEIYRKQLENYTKLLVDEGIDSIKEIYALMEEILETITSLEEKIAAVKIVSSDLSTDLATTFYETLCSINKKYGALFMDYTKLKKVLDSNIIKCSLSEDSINYIIKNTSLLHLVYTNNTHPKIEINPENLNHMFSCPFHKNSDGTLDMEVRIDENYFLCHHCGTQGNQIDYLMEYEGITYIQAIYLLAEIYLIDIPNNPYKDERNSEVVNKYRNKLVSEEYWNMLIELYNSLKTKNIDIDSIFAHLFIQVQRVKDGINDTDFVYKEKTKKFKLDKPFDLNKIGVLFVDISEN